MRAGYDRVSSDTRRPIIPDLPVVKKSDTAKPEKGARMITVLGAATAVALTVVAGAMLLFGATLNTVREVPTQVGDRQ
jgi:hypothetical protein